jgi:DNA processing protein
VVFAGGVDRVFPEENLALAETILDQGGALVSEMPIGCKPRAKDFPRRNRLIAGIAQGLLVVEAAKRSGSPISARLASEAGRNVYALRDSPLDPRCGGANWLIKQGATLVTEASEIVDDMHGTLIDKDNGFDAITPEDDSMEPELDVADVRPLITAALGPSPEEIDDIIRHRGATNGQVQLVLIELDRLAGLSAIREVGYRSLSNDEGSKMS